MMTMLNQLGQQQSATMEVFVSLQLMSIRRASKRSRKESRKETLKELHAKERPAVLQEQLDPTAGRRNSRTRVYSGRRKTSE